MQVSRRDFLKISAPVVGMLVLGRMPASTGLAQNPLTASTRIAEKAKLYDASRCVGCRACQTACRRWNELPPESIGYGGIYDNPSDLSARTWTLIKFKELGANGTRELLFCKYQCMHCTNASCEAVCPTGAISHQGDAVVINQERCIGCGYCVQVCPFGVPHKDEDEGTARKCTFCIDRITQGLKPACVEACPAGAIIYGDWDKLVTEGRRRVATLKLPHSEAYPRAMLYGETELGGLHVLYVLADSPDVYSLPKSPEFPVSANIRRDILRPYAWIVWVVVALGLALNVLVARARQLRVKEEEI